MKNLTDPDERVIKASIDCIEKTKNSKCIDYLIQALRFHEGRGQQGVNETIHMRIALSKLTGEDMQVSDDWENWWASRKNTWTGPPKEKKTADHTKVKSTLPKFFDI